MSNRRSKPRRDRLSRPVAFLLATAIALCAVVASAQGESSKRSALQDSVKTLRAEGRYSEAQTLAEDLAAVVSRDSTAHSYEIVDARQLLATMTTAAGFSRQDQMAFAKADSLGRLVEDLYGLAQYSEAEDCIKRQIEIYERLLALDHPDVATSLNDLAVMCYAQGRYAQAEPLYQRSLAIREKTLGPDHPDVATTLDNLAMLCYEQGHYALAEPLFKRSLAIWEKVRGPDHPDVATNLNNLAMLYHGQGQYAQAEPLFKRALAIWEKALGPDHPDVALSLHNLAETYRAQGRYAQAEPLYRRSLAMWVKALGPDHPNVATSLNNFAILYHRQGQYAQAEPLHQRALAIREKALGPDHPDVATSLNNLAALYHGQGQYAQAEPLFQRSLAISEKALGPDHPEVGKSLNNLAESYRGRGRDAQAEPLLKRALAIREKALGPDHPEVALSLHNLAKLYKAQGLDAQAEPLYQRSLAISEKALGPDHPEVALSLHNLAKLYMAQGQDAQAEPLFRRSLAIWERALGPDHPEVVSGLVSLAGLYLSTGHPDSAATVLTLAADRFESARLRVGRGIKRATFQESPYPALAVASLFNGATAQAWPAAERTGGRALADLLLAARRRPLTETELACEDSLAIEVRKLEPRLATLIKGAHADNSAEARQRVQTTRLELLAADARWSEFAQAMARKYPIAEGQSYPLERVQAVLGEKQAIVGWLDFEVKKGEYVSWAYVLCRRGPVTWVRLAGPAGAVSGSPFEQARACRDAFDDVDATDTSVATFSATRFQPLLSALDGIDDLIVIPTGAMSTIPIEALSDEQGRFIGDRFTVSYTPSATIYTWLQDQKQTRQAAAMPTRTLLLGDPPFTLAQKNAMALDEAPVLAVASIPEGITDTATLREARAGNVEAIARLPRLPGTRAEVNAIARVAPSPTLLVGPEATEQELHRLARSGNLAACRTIHLATHGFVDPEQPERSCLVLSQVDLPDAYAAAVKGERIYDGRLTVQEILQEWKLEADLVTLSACETALGKQISGEGLVGFAHAFLQAGASSLLVSLWKVDDRATSLLMTRFYGNLWQEKMPKAAALREAKQWLRGYEDETGQRPYDHPYFWSAFILIGDRG